MSLRLLSALEVMQARRAASLLAEEERERALCSNACLLARALEKAPGKPLFHSGQEVLAGLTVEEISALARRWSQFDREENPGLSLTEEELEHAKKNSGALPTEERAKQMRDSDYLWCLVNGLLDREEELERLCPACQAAAREERCPVCGRPAEESEGWVNPAFDEDRFRAMKRGERT